MTELIISLSIIFASILLIVLTQKLTNKKISIIILKCLSIALFLVFTYQIFETDYINTIVKFNSFLSVSEIIFLIVLRTLTVISVAVAIVTPFFGVKTLKNLLNFVALPVNILNIIFFDLNLSALFGNDYANYSTFRIVMFAIQIVLVSVIAITNLYNRIITKDFSKNLKQLAKNAGVTLAMLVLLMLALFPEYFFVNTLGTFTQEAEGFNLIHRILLYISFLLPLFVVAVFGKYSYTVRKSVAILMSLACFFQYFNKFTFEFNPTNLPLHLCNTAVALMLIAFVFDLKPVFYFTYLVNVSGSLFALLLPSDVGLFGTYGSMNFWINHIYVFALPLIGVGLKLFPRPTFKMVRGAIYIFTIYIVSVAFLNAWFANYGSVDYFFLNKNFIVDMFEFLRPVKENFILSFTINDLVFNIYWLYDIVVYVAYIGFILIAWLIYSYVFKVTDHYTELAKFRRADELEIAKLKRMLKGKKLSDPVDPEGVNMVKITNFSKRYGNSNKYAVKNLNLEIKEGQVFGFLGHNGAGKSTTIKSLVGIQSITEGSMNVFGYDVATQPLQAKMLIGYVSDNHATYEHLTGREFVNYIADLYNVSTEERNEAINKYVDLFQLTDAFDREIKSYSHGMKQKIMVISSLVHNPKLWVLDEPLTGLDPTSAFQIKNCIEEHAKKGNIVFFSSHIIEVVEKVCDKIAIIAKGELQGVYDLKELEKQGKSVEEVYMGFYDTNFENKDKNKNSTSKPKTTKTTKKVTSTKTAKTKNPTIKKQKAETK